MQWNQATNLCEPTEKKLIVFIVSSNLLMKTKIGASKENQIKKVPRILSLNKRIKLKNTDSLTTQPYQRKWNVFFHIHNIFLVLFIFDILYLRRFYFPYVWAQCCLFHFPFVALCRGRPQIFVLVFSPMFLVRLWPEVIYVRNFKLLHNRRWI